MTVIILLKSIYYILSLILWDRFRGLVSSSWSLNLDIPTVRPLIILSFLTRNTSGAEEV